MAKSFKEREYERLGKTLQANSATSGKQSAYDSALQKYIGNAGANSTATQKKAASAQQQSKTIQQLGTEAWKQRSPLAAQKLSEYETFLKKGGVLDEDEKGILTGNGFYMPQNIADVTTAKGRNAVRTALLDQLGYINKHRGEGLWDVEGNNVSYMSDDYLNKLLEKYQGELEQSVADDAAWDAVKEEKGLEWEKAKRDQTRWQQLYAEKDKGYGENPSDVDLSDQWQNWLMADYLLGDQEDLYDFEKINAAYEAMSDEEYDTEAARLDEQFRNLDWNTLMYPEQPYTSQTSTLQASVDAVQKEIDNRAKMAEYRQMATGITGYEDLAEYIDSLDEESRIRKMADPGYFVNNAGATSTGLTSTWEFPQQMATGMKLYFNALFNGGKFDGGQTAEKIVDSIATDGTVTNYYNKGWNLLTDDEKVIYNILAQSGNTEAADEWLELLTPYTQERRYEYNRALDNPFVTSDDPGVFLAVQGSAVASNAIDMLTSPAKLLEVVQGVDNPYSAVHDYANYASNARANQMNTIENQEDLNAVLKWLEKTGYTGINGFLDNAIRNVAALGNPAASAILAGAQSFSGSLTESAGREIDAGAKIIKAIADGVSEVGTEKIGLDALFDMGQDSALKYFASTMLSELGEETANTLMNDFTEGLLSVLFDYESEITSGADVWDDILDTWYQTAASTFFSGGAGALNMTLQNKSLVNQVNQNGSMDTVISIGKELGTGTESYKLAEKLEQKKREGHKLRLNEQGALIRAVTEDVGTQNAQAVQDVLTESVEERLVQLGETEEEAKKTAPAISKMYLGEKLSLKDRAMVNWSDNADQVMKELHAPIQEGEEGRTGKAWAAKTRMNVMAESMRSVEKNTKLEKALGLKGKEQSANAEAQAEAGQEATKTATEKAVEAAAETATKKQEAVKKLNLGAKMVSFSDGAGESATGEFQRVEKKGGKLVAVVSSGENQNTMVNLSDVEGTGDDGLTTILEYAQNEGRDMSAEEVNTMVKAYQDEGGDVNAFISGFEDAYLAGYTGLNENQQREGIAAIAYEQGKAEAQQDEQKRLQRVRNAKRTTTGKVTWIGQVKSFSEITGKGNETSMTEAMQTLTESQKDVARLVERFAEKFKVDVALYESDLGSQVTLPNGQYDHTTNTVYLDVQGGALTAEDAANLRKNGTLGNAMLKYLGHELTHAIESGSAEGYAAYRQAVKDTLRKRGMSYEALVRSKLETAQAQGAKLTLGGAEAEVIADASEYMLENTAFISNAPKRIKNQVKIVISNFAKKVRAVFATLTGGHRESQAIRELKNNMYRYVDNLQNLWDIAATEMVDGTQNAVETQETTQNAQEAEHTVPVEELKPEKQFSMRSDVEKREDGLIAVHNLRESDLLTMLTELGGIPAPSFAVVKAKQGHTKFGEISAIVKSRTIDPQVNSENRVYGNDAWTPTFPPVEREINKNSVFEQRSHAKELLTNVDSRIAEEANKFYNMFAGQNETGDDMREFVAYGKTNKGVMAEYLTERGEMVDIPTREIKEELGYDVGKAGLYDKILDKIGYEELKNMNARDLLNNYGTWLSQQDDELARLWESYKQAKDAGQKFNIRMAIRDRVKAAVKYEEAGRRLEQRTIVEKNYNAAAADMYKKIDKEEFTAWLEEKINRMLGRKGVYNGKERYKANGDRIPFAQTHAAYTAENVVRLMKQGDESDTGHADTAKGIMFEAAKRYGSLDEIREDSARLQTVDERERQKMFEEADKELSKFFTALDVMGFNEEKKVGNLLARAGRKNMTTQETVTLFKRNGYKKITVGIAEEGLSIVKALQNLPTEYFEAKLMRVVGFDEIIMLVVPDNISIDLWVAIVEKGIPYTTYEAGNDTDRIEKMNSVKDVQFSLRDSAGNEVTLTSEEVEENKEYVANMQPVVTLTGNPMQKDGNGDFYTKGVAYFNEIGNAAENPVLGRVALTEKGIRHLINRRLTWRKTALLRAVKPVIENGRILHVENDHNGKDTAIIAGSVSLDETQYYMGVVVSQNSEMSNMYEVHDAVVVEKQKEGNTALTKTPSAGEDQTRRGGDLPIAIILSDLANYNREFTENSQYALRDDQTQTEEFKRWFGDSVVVNEDGSPKVMYHGTNANKEFTVFNTYGGKFGLFGIGSYFTDDKSVAESYTQKGKGTNPRVYEVYLSIKNPLDMDAPFDAEAWMGDDADLNEYFKNAKTNEEAFKALKEYCADEEMYRDEAQDFIMDYILNMGYDGITHIGGGRYNKQDTNRHRVYIAFEPEQIKSATDNVGTFDPQNPDIRYARRDDLTMADVREILSGMEVTDRMNDTEKDMLTRYKAKLLTVQDLQTQIDQQKSIIASETATADEKAAATARMRIYTEKQRRAQRYLRTAEGSNGFARLMATSQELARRLTSNDAENAADSLETEIGELTEKLDAVNRTLTQTRETMKSAEVRAMFAPQKLEQAVSTLKASYGLKMSQQELRNRLAALYADYAAQTARGQIGQNFTDEVRDLAADMYESQKAGQNYNSELLEDISLNMGGTLQLSDSEVAQLKKQGISYSEFKRTLSPYIKVTRGGTGSQVLATAQAAQYYAGGGPLAAMMEGVMNDVDALNILYDTFANEKAAMQEKNAPGTTQEQMIASIMGDIMGELIMPDMGGETAKRLKAALKRSGSNLEAATNILSEAVEEARKSTSDAGRVWSKFAQYRYEAKTAAEYYRALEEKRRLTELKEQAETLTEQLTSAAADKLAEYREKQMDLNAIRAQTEKNRATEKRIRTKVKRLDKLIRRETDQKHIPEGFKPVVEELMRLFAGHDGDINTFGNPSTEAGQHSITVAWAAYEQLRMTDGTDLNQMNDYYDYDVSQNLIEMKELLKQLSMDNGLAGTERLQKKAELMKRAEEIVDMIAHTAENIGKVQIGEKSVALEQIAGRIKQELDKKDTYSTRKGVMGKAASKANTLRYGNMTPAYFFRDLNLTPMTELSNELFRAEDKYGKLFHEAQDAIGKMEQKYHYWDWVFDDPLTFTTQQGLEIKQTERHKITIDKGTALQLYATWKRESQKAPLIQTNHLREGGFEFATAQEVDGRLVYDQTAHKLSELDMRTIENYLTDEQKQFADAFVAYLTELGGTLGNETSMEMFGIKKFKDTYYFPIQVAKGQLHQQSNAGSGTTDDSRIKHMPFTNRRINGAVKPISVSSFVDVGTRHIQQMLTYHTFAVPLENMNKVLNQAFTDEDTGSRTTIREMIKQKYGQEAISYLEKFIADMNGGIRKDSTEKGFIRMLSSFKKGATAASLSVAIQQPTSIIRALAEVPAKYFVPFTHGDTNTQYREEWEQLTKHSGVAVIKEVGGIDMTRSGSMADDLAGNLEDGYNVFKKAKLALGFGAPKGERAAAAMRQWDNIFGKLAETGDKVAWIAMWRAIKNETKALNPQMDINSDEFLDKAGERFNDVMRLTQVYDSTLARSQWMRSSSGLMKMVTSFGAEGTLTANMLYDGFKNGDAKTKAKTAAIFFASQIITAAAAAIIKAGRDDDKDKAYAEKYLSAMGGALGGWGGAFNPLSVLPGVRDVMNLLDGYDVERSDMSIVSDLISAAEKLANGKYDNTWQAVENAGGALANAFGVPVKNIMRDARTLYNTALGLFDPPRASNRIAMTKDALDNFTYNFVFEPDTSVSAYYAKLYKAMEEGDAQEEADLREYLTIIGKDAQDIKTGLKNAAKAKYNDGKLTDEEAIQWLVKNGHAEEEDDAYWIVEEWKYKQENGKGSTYSKYADFYKAVETGENLKSTIKHYTDNGVTKGVLKGRVTDMYFDELLSLWMNGKKGEYSNLLARMLTAYEALGYNRLEMQKEIEKKRDKEIKEKKEAEKKKK